MLIKIEIPSQYTTLWIKRYSNWWRSIKFGEWSFAIRQSENALCYRAAFSHAFSIVYLRLDQTKADGAFFFFAQLFSHFHPFFSRLFKYLSLSLFSQHNPFAFPQKRFLLRCAMEFSRKMILFLPFKSVPKSSFWRRQKRSKTALVIWNEIHEIGMCSFVN